MSEGRSEDSRRLGLFPGSFRGFPRNTPGKTLTIFGETLPESRNAFHPRVRCLALGPFFALLGSLS